MSSIFPLRDTVRRDETQEPRLVELDEETADEVFETLAASTTREIFLSIHEQPQTASDLAEVTDTSVQNVQYHLEKLEDADLVTVVDTWYSERGSEMEVYGPEDESLVMYAGRDKQSTFQSILNRMLGLASFIVPTSILAGFVASRAVTESGDGSGEPTVQEETEQLDVESVDLPEGGVEAVEPRNQGEIGIQSTPEYDVYLQGNETDGADLIIGQNYTDTPVLITDGGNATVLPDSAVSPTGELLSDQATSTAAESSTAVDPALLAGAAFLCGALVVLVGLWAWYGTPE